jgi:hypothetical protein
MLGTRPTAPDQRELEPFLRAQASAPRSLISPVSRSSFLRASIRSPDPLQSLGVRLRERRARLKDVGRLAKDRREVPRLLARLCGYTYRSAECVLNST